MTKAEEALNHIEMLYPPDSQYESTREIGRDLMDNTVGNSVGYDNWRELSGNQLIDLAVANLEKHGENQIAWDLKMSKTTRPQPDHIAHLSS